MNQGTNIDCKYEQDYVNEKMHATSSLLATKHD